MVRSFGAIKSKLKIIMIILLSFAAYIQYISVGLMPIAVNDWLDLQHFKFVVNIMQNIMLPRSSKDLPNM